MTISPSQVANSNFRSSDLISSNSDFLDLFHLARKEKLECSQLRRTFKRLRRGIALGAILVMFQGSSAALTSAWADGCVDNPTYCVVSTADTLIVNEGEHTLRSAVATANGSGASSSTIGFADQLFGIVRDPSGTVTSSTANYQTPVVITLDSTLEIRSNLTIKAPTLENSPQILTIQRGAIQAGDPLISINPPTPQAEMQVNGADVKVQIENVTLDSNANPNTGNLNDPKSTPGVTIQVNQTEVTTENGPTLVTPEVVLKSTQVLNAVSESGGAAVNTSGDVRIENSTLVGNMAISSGNGTPSDGGAIKAEGAVTVVNSALNGNSATGNGGAISAATTVTVVDSSQITGNIAGGNGGAISAGTSVEVSNTTLSENQSGTAIEGQNYVATQSGGDGGAIHSSGSVTVFNTVIEYNRATGGSGEVRADGQGGGIAAAGEVLVQGSVISSNSSEGNGGGISANIVIVAPTQIRSEISNNFAEGNGGAIAATQSVQIVSTVQAETQLKTILNENISTSSGGAIASGGEVSVYKAEITGNTAANDGGAIQSASTVTIQGSTLSLNVAGGVRVEIGFAPSATGGNGGAISAAGDVTIIQSTFVSNQANSGLVTNTAGNGGAIHSQTDINVSDQSSFELNSAGGNGGAIAAVNTSVADSTFNGNVAVLKGGAISGGGTVTTSQSAFGTITVENPDYNPLIRSEPNPQYSPLAVIENPDYNPLVEVINPNFNPSMEVINPNFNISVSPTISNPNYKVDVPQVIPNPACPAGSRIYDGEDFGQGPLYICEFQIDNGDGTISFGNLPSKVTNPLYDDRADLPNPLYDNRPIITVLTNPDELEDTRETLLMLQRPELPENDSQFIPNPDHALPEIIETYLHPGEPRDDRATLVLSNSAGEVGGSIYAGESVDISDSTFEGSNAHDFGGAIDIDDSSEMFSSISNSTFLKNSASSAGAVDGNQGMLNIHNTRFEENVATDGDGGAIWHIAGLSITDSKFIFNDSSENGGAITLDAGSMGAPYLQIARTVFTRNSSSNNGGAIAILGQEVGDHVSVIISSIFDGNSADNMGGAIYGSLASLFNTYKNNEATFGSAVYTPMDTTSGVSPQDLSPTFLGNLFQAYGSNMEICNIANLHGYFTEFNLATDETCFDASSTNSLENRETLIEKSSDFIPNDYVRELMDQVDSFDSSTNFVYGFIKSEITKDFKSLPRLREVNWSAGHLQQIFSVIPEVVIPEIPITDNFIQDEVKQKIETPEIVTPILITTAQQITEADRIKMIELLAASKKAQEDLAKQAAFDAEARAKMIAASKKARNDAFAKRAAERKARLAALAAKIAATKSRGEALKQKPSWINLMQNYSKLQIVKNN